MSDLLPTPQSSYGSPEPGYTNIGMPGEHGSLRFRRLMIFVRRYWWIPFLTSLLFMGAGVGYVAWAPPTFISFARMWEAEKMRLPGGAAFDENSQTYYGTQAELLKSERLTQLTLDTMKLTRTNDLPKDMYGRPLKVDINVKQQPRSTVLLLEASSSDAEFTRAYLDALMAAFQVYRREVRQSVSGITLSSIAEQVKRLETDLALDQKAYNEFQRSNNVAILQEEALVSGGYLARLKTQLSDLQLEGKLLEAAMLEHSAPGAGMSNAVPYLLESLRGGNSGSNTSGRGDRQYALKELELLKINRDKLGRVYKPKHPKMVKLNADIERGEKLVELYRNQTREQLTSAQQAVKMRTESVLASIEEWETKLVGSKARLTEAERLRQNMSRSQGLYDRLLVLLENVDISRSINQETLSVLDQATPARRSYRMAIVCLVLGGLAGLVAGLALVWLIEARDDRFISVQDVTATFGDSIVGQIPEITGSRAKTNGDLSGETENHLLTESYRSLRAALLFLPMEAQQPKVILVTSAAPDEGKSTIAINLARSMATGGRHVLLVDCDLRKGELHRRLSLKREPGLVDLLQMPSLAQEAFQTNGIPDLTLIARGRGHVNPGDLLLAPALDEFLAQWRKAFDYVILDTCPVFAAADVAALAPKADGTLIVVSRGRSSARMVNESVELLLQRQAKILGLVFNRADATARSYHYYKYAEYHEQEAEVAEADRKAG